MVKERRLGSLGLMFFSAVLVAQTPMSPAPAYSIGSIPAQTAYYSEVLEFRVQGDKVDEQVSVALPNNIQGKITFEGGVFRYTPPRPICEPLLSISKVQLGEIKMSPSVRGINLLRVQYLLKVLCQHLTVRTIPT